MTRHLDLILEGSKSCWCNFNRSVFPESHWGSPCTWGLARKQKASQRRWRCLEHTHPPLRFPGKCQYIPSLFGNCCVAYWAEGFHFGMYWKDSYLFRKYLELHQQIIGGGEWTPFQRSQASHVQGIGFAKRKRRLFNIPEIGRHMLVKFSPPHFRDEKIWRRRILYGMVGSRLVSLGGRNSEDLKQMAVFHETRLGVEPGWVLKLKQGNHCFRNCEGPDSCCEPFKRGIYSTYHKCLRCNCM